MRALRLSALCLLCLLGACSERAGSSEQREQAQRLVSKTPTRPAHRLDIGFGEAVKLIGYDLSSDQVAAGKSVTVTWHWQVLRRLPAGYQQFTHLADGRGKSRVNLDLEGVLRQGYPAQEWEAGSYVRDPQQITVPGDWGSSEARLYLGFWKDEERLEIKGPNDGLRRARALTLKVLGGEPEAQLPELRAKRARELELDGVLDEPAWQAATPTAAFVNTMSGAAAEPKTSVKALWDDANLYVAFEVDDRFLKSKFQARDDHLWEADCVEIMVDPDGDGLNYFELQVSPRNQVFDTRYDSRRKPQPFGHMDWNAAVKSAVALHGGGIDDDKPDQGYTVELAIPWAAFAEGEPKHAPPRAGDVFRINFYLMDAREAGMRAVGWSPPRVGDFHVPNRFGRIVFEGS